MGKREKENNVQASRVPEATLCRGEQPSVLEVGTEAAFPGVAVGSPHGCLDEVGIGCEGLTVECGHTTEELIRPRTLNPQMLNKWLMVLWSASLRTLSEEGLLHRLFLRTLCWLSLSLFISHMLTGFS